MKARYIRQPPLTKIPIRLGRLWLGYRPNWFETGHVRRYAATGFASRLSEQGFSVSKVSVDDLFDESDVLRHGFNREVVYFATKPSRAE